MIERICERFSTPGRMFSIQGNLRIENVDLAVAVALHSIVGSANGF